MASRGASAKLGGALTNLRLFGPKTAICCVKRPRTCSKWPNKGKRLVHYMCGLASPCPPLAHFEPILSPFEPHLGDIVYTCCILYSQPQGGAQGRWVWPRNTKLTLRVSKCLLSTASVFCSRLFVATSPLPSWGPTCGQSGYISLAVSELLARNGLGLCPDERAKHPWPKAVLLIKPKLENGCLRVTFRHILCTTKCHVMQMHCACIVQCQPAHDGIHCKPCCTAQCIACDPHPHCAAVQHN